MTARRSVLCVVGVIVVAILAASDVGAFHLSTHRKILMEALYRNGVIVNGERLKFDVDSVMKIDEENGALDRHETLENLLGIDGDPVWHFDDEKIADSNARLIDLRKSILRKLVEGKLDSARALLGQATHLLSDFYAHTNWIELGNDAPNIDVGIRPLTTPIASVGESTCANDGASLKGVGLTKLTSGYFAGIKTCTLPSGKCRHGGPAACRAGRARRWTRPATPARQTWPT